MVHFKSLPQWLLVCFYTIIDDLASLNVQHLKPRRGDKFLISVGGHFNVLTYLSINYPLYIIFVFSILYLDIHSQYALLQDG